MSVSPTVTIAAQNFWGKIFWGATECIGLLVVLHIKLAKTEVTQSDVASVVQKNIFWFQIAIDNIQFMEVFQSEEKFSTVEAVGRVRQVQL